MTRRRRFYGRSDTGTVAKHTYTHNQYYQRENGRVPYITIQQMANYNKATHTRSRNLDVGGVAVTR